MRKLVIEKAAVRANMAVVRKRAAGAALYGVAGVHQGDPVRPVLRLHLLGIGGHPGISQAVLNAAVDVVGV